MDGLVVGRERRFFHGLRKRRVAVAGPGDVLARRAVFHGQYALRDQLSRVRAHDVSAEDLVGLGVRDKLDDSFGVVRGSSSLFFI